MARPTPPAFARWAAAATLSASLAAAATAAPRNFSPALDRALENSRDYVLASELSAKSLGKSITDGGCDPCWGQVVRYTTFSQPQQTYDVRRYDGEEITLLIPTVHPRATLVTPERIRTLVDRLDLLYAMYTELLGWSPTRTRDPLGKQIFAFVPNDPANWYGLAFVPGDSSEYSNAVLAELALDDDVLSNVWVHELAHNFDPIGHWDYGADPAHDWTTFMQTWVARRLARMDDDGRKRWDAFEVDWTDSRWTAWRANPTDLTWQRCVVDSPRPAVCDSVGQMAGVLMATAARYVDPSVIRQWLRSVRTDATRPVTPQERSDYLLRTLADATRTDTRCVAQHFRWPAGAGLGAAAQYATPFAGCVDADGDGARRFDDCDDTRATVRPGAPETIDGRDNDCNGVVDERSISESTTGDFINDIFGGTPVGGAPLTIAGTLSSASDRDSVRLERDLPPGRAYVRLCPTGSRMSLVGLSSDGVAWGPLAGTAPGGCSVFSGSERAWRGFTVEGGAGTYTLEISTLAEGWPRPRAITLGTDGSNGARAVVDAARVPGGTSGVEVRWTGSGSGVLKSGPLANASSLVGPSLPATTMDRATTERHQLRAQLFRDGLPIEEPSRPFTVATEGFALSSGITVSSTLPAGRDEERWYIDIPANATRLTVNTTSAQNIDVHAARVAASGPAVAVPSIAVAPARSLALGSATTASGNETLVVNAPAAGRWYVTPTNSAPQAASYTLRATVEATPPAIRAGGYFNPARPGHGLFVHPAGGEWAGLWYTYDSGNQPTWYYLQGAAPGANGQWNGTLYRARWDGAAAQLQPVGNAVLTPGAENGFSFSYNLDGVAGSEAFRSFGRGCPSVGGGAAVNASQHYFDPARAGSGYSVQLMTAPAAYEFYAAFIYDSRGDPRFLVAESGGTGARDESVALEQLRGFCPLCTHAAVTRQPAGTLRRVYSSAGILERIVLDARFTNGLSGEWDVSDAVRMLDDSRRAQGCTL
jgi:hypothetical protein